MAAAGFDVVVGIAMYSIFESVAVAMAKQELDSETPVVLAHRLLLVGGNGVVDTGDSKEWLIARGPLSIPLGLVAAVLCGVGLGCTKLLNKPYRRTLLTFCLGELLMFI